MSKRPRILVVHDGNETKEFVFAKLAAMEADIYAVSTPEPSWWHAQVPADRSFRTNAYDADRLVHDTAVFAAAHDLTFDAVGTFSEGCVTETADLVAALDLIGVSPGAARRSSTDKLLMRQFCARAGVPTPRFTVLKDLDEASLRAAVERVGIPCVIKPASGMQSWGTRKLEAESEIREAVRDVRASWPEGEAQSASILRQTTAFLVEEYLHGPVLSVDGIVQDGAVQVLAGLNEFGMGPEPHFVQEINVIPSSFEPTVQDACSRLAADVIGALGLDDCAFHCEQRLTERGPQLLEIAARAPGGPMMLAYEIATGVDYVAAQLDLWLGRPVDLTPTRRQFVKCKGLFHYRPGTLRGIDGVESASQVPGVVAVLPLARTGQAITTLPQTPQPIAFYMVVGDSRDEVERAGDEVEARLRVDVAEAA